MSQLRTYRVFLAFLVGLTLAASFPGAGQPAGDAVLSAAPGGTLVDPLLIAGFETVDSQVAILILDPAAIATVLEEMERDGIDHHLYSELQMVAAVLTREQVLHFADMSGVLTIFRNESMHAYLDKSTGYTGARVVWNTYKVRGKGATILVVDSGVDGNHPDVKYRENLIENVVPARQSSAIVGGSREGVPATDADGHGTHVAAIVGGTAKAPVDEGKYKGVAYEAKLIGFQAGITDPNTGEVSFESTTVLEAFNYGLANRKKFNITIVTNSWGSNGEFEIQSPINQATLKMYKAGLLVLFAAGNEGADGEHTLNRYSVAPWVLGVGAGDYLANIARFSSRGTDNESSGLAYDHPDVIAPGVSITSARATAGTPATGIDPVGVTKGSGSDVLYTVKSGTSMATPHVAGIAALLVSANPQLSPDDVMDILTATVKPLTKYEVWEAGAGYVNALDAYQLAVKTKGARETFLAGKVKYAGPETGDPKLERDAVSVGYGAGAARQVEAPIQNVGEFAEDLAGSSHGLVFMIGTAALALLSFRFGRRF